MVKSGTVALVTGGGKGVGAGVAKVFSRHGVRVAINYNSSEEMARATLRIILDEGGDAFLIRADVSDRAQVARMVGEVVERYGGIDALVNNAALQPNRHIRQYDGALLAKVWEVNVGGYWRVTQECIPHLRASDCPRVVNISSLHGKRPSIFDIGYSMSKGGVRMFTREAAVELARYGITVNCIDLGACKIEKKTGVAGYEPIPYAFPHWPQETRKNPHQPLGRIAEPEDVGHLALYLISPEARNTNGDGIRLDGGAMLT